MKFLQRMSVKEKSQEQELTGTEVARKIKEDEDEVKEVQKETKQSEQCREPERARVQERRRNTQKLSQRAKELSKLIPMTK